MTTLLVTCGRCGLLTVTAAGAGIGSRCPACGDRAVDVTDLAPERTPDGPTLGPCRAGLYATGGAAAPRPGRRELVAATP
jgi:hypothetical protein